MWSYALFLSTVFVAPTLLLAALFREWLEGTRGQYLAGVGAALLFGVPMEYHFVGFDVLYHPADAVLGPSLGGVPLEAFLFYVTAGTAIVTVTVLLCRWRGLPG
jgi:NO-binding membrane sensor protein with MHYT domain